jgi:hypothetical protein
MNGGLPMNNNIGFTNSKENAPHRYSGVASIEAMRQLPH